MGQDLTLPVDRVPAVLILTDGSRHEVSIFFAAGQDLAEVMESGQAFLPATELGGRFRLFSRRALACIRLPHGGASVAELDALPLCRRTAAIRLLSGILLTGELRYLAPPERRRTADYLNEPAASFPVYAEDGVYHVAKNQVAYLEEA
jgi:hypothetical protein